MNIFQKMCFIERISNFYFPNLNTIQLILIAYFLIKINLNCLNLQISMSNKFY
jgi:hypothetical protein